MTTPKNWRILVKALDFYAQHGFVEVDAPWLVSSAAGAITRQAQCDGFWIREREVIASGEQGFLDMILQNKLAPGRYVTLTPCFREEAEVSDTVRDYFAKVEIIDTLNPEAWLALADLALGLLNLTARKLTWFSRKMARIFFPLESNLVVMDGGRIPQSGRGLMAPVLRSRDFPLPPPHLKRNKRFAGLRGADASPCDVYFTLFVVGG